MAPFTDDDFDATLPESTTGENSGNVSQEEYDTQGRTTVATRRGYAFQPTDNDLPLVTHTGIQVTREQANALVDESDGVVHIVENEED